MPTHVITCRKCGKEDERYYPSFEAADRGLKQWRCPDCGCPKYEKKPQSTFWHFSDAMKAKQ